MLMDMLAYSFMQRALVSGIFIAVSCAGLGVFLVLRRFAMIGEGLAHVGFSAVALGLVLGVTPMTVIIPVLMVISLWILKLGEETAMYSDTAIGLVSSLAIAVGVLLASVSRGFNVDLFSYLFGSILAITSGEVWMSVILSILVVASLRLFYHDLFATTYDEDFAKVSGVRTDRINKVLILLTALTIALGIRVVGTLLVSSLVIFPAVTALQLSMGFRGTLISASVSAVIGVVTGILLSFVLNLPTGASIVLINFILFGAAYLYGRFSGRTT